MSRLDKAYAGVDAANSEDPNRVVEDGVEQPSELVYGRRMTAMLERLHPEASEALRLAVRAQHIRRWQVPRSTYPMDRPGYLRWRTDLQRKHAEWTGVILKECGYDEPEIARVGALIRKEKLRQDPEAQALEDAAALVFLAHYADAFAAKHEREKVVTILAKTFAKMSDHGRQAAAGLDMSPALKSAMADAAALKAPTR